MSRQALQLVAVTWLALSPPAHADTASTAGRLSKEEVRFLNYVAEDNQAEIQLCLLAEKKAQSPAVKAFARLMVDDHVQIQSRLGALINDENVDVSNGVGEDGKKTMSKLEPLRGGDFDRQFLDAQIEDHGNDVRKFETGNSQSQSKGIRQFTAQTLPILKQHLSLARAIQASLKSQPAQASKH